MNDSFILSYKIFLNLNILSIVTQNLTTWGVSEIGVFSGQYFPLVGQNTEIYRINFRIQSKYGKLRTSFYTNLANDEVD